MYSKKQLFVHIIFLGELCFFVYGYVWGNHGIINLYQCKKANTILLDQIASERKVLDRLSERIVAWNNNLFYKERYAREQLHMARKGEIIYISS